MAGINVKGKIFRCDIQKSEEAIESLYVYIGRKGKHCTLFVDLLSAYMCIISDDGDFRSINMSFAANNFEDGFTLMCLSDSGPTTKVKWSRNQVKIEEDQNIYTTSQRILSTSHYPVYENRLIVKRKEGGVYKCEISNCFVIYKPTEGVTEHHSRSDCTCRSNVLPVSPMIIYLNK